MLTFEEFFKKKKIDLPQLKAAEPTLFAEFERHYNQMGEKSFDHTKKYWFNPLRRKYHTPPEEPKVEKVVIENILAEQTITDSLSEQSTEPAPKLGFKPKFSTGAKPVVPVESTPENKPETETVPAETPAPKLGFKPKFKTAATTTPVEDQPVAPEEKSEPTPTSEAPAPKLGFKPKFKSATTPTTPIEDKPVASEQTAQPTTTEETPAPKLGFKPKFKAGVTKTVETAPEIQEESPKTEETTEPQPEAKPAYKPKFQARNFKPKTGDE